MKSLLKVSAIVAVLLGVGMCGCEPAPLLPLPDKPVPVTGPGGCPELVTETLPNGMTIIVKPMRSAPVVCVRAYVRTGAIYEGPWLGSGISHLTEHLVARDASHDMGEDTDEQARKASDRVREIGGQSNAYTSLSSTCYYISASAGKTNECIDLVADWMASPEITQEDFDREHGVVQRELEMRKDSPDRQMWRVHSRNLFGSHPASVPVIGYAKPLAQLMRQDVLAYHKRMYVPQNMVFCVVGDIDVPAALQRVRDAFVDFDAGRAPDLTLPAVQSIATVRRTVQPHDTATETLERISFLTVPLADDDLYPLDVLSYVLTNGQASRLVRRVKRERNLVTAISSSSWTPPWGRGPFTIGFRAEPDNADAAEGAILGQLRAIAAAGITAPELERAKRQKVADLVFSLQTAESQAATLSTDFLSTGDARFSTDYTRRIQEVTVDDIRRVAKKYFRFDGMAITRLVPSDSYTTAMAQRAGPAKAQTVMFDLDNGLRVILHPNPSVGLVSMTFVTAGGLLLEDDDTNGMGTLMTALSTRGAGTRSAGEIGSFFDEAGGSIAGNCGNNTFYWQGTVLDDRFGEALDILADVIRYPMFSEKELEIVRPTLLSTVRRVDEDWFRQAQRHFHERFFTGSPYRMLAVGRENVIHDATRKDIVEYHRRNIKAGSSVLAIYGNFDLSEARGRVERVFGPLAEGKVELLSPPRTHVDPTGEVYVLETDKKVAGIFVAVPGMKIDNLDDRFAITVLDTIISGYRMPSGWLHEELRGKKLVYVVHAYNWAGLAPGAFVVYAACRPENAREVVDIIQRNLSKAASYTPTQDEINEAVRLILTAELLDNQSMSQLSMSAALDELYGFGYDFRSRLETYYGKVTPEEVARVAKKYLSGGMLVAVATPAPDALGESAGKKPPSQKPDAKKNEPDSGNDAIRLIPTGKNTQPTLTTRPAKDAE